MRSSFRAVAVILVPALLLFGSMSPAVAQLEQIPIPELPPEIEDPLAGVIDTIGDGVIGAVGDIPLDNAVVLLGDDGVEAAINLSKITFPDGQSPVALISRSTIFADSLSSGGAQGVVQAPLLVTAETELDPRVVEELERLGSTQVIVLGNEAAISEAVVGELEALGLRVDRVGGPTRVETAWEVAGAIMPGATEAILARAYPGADGDDSQAYVDSLSVGPWAAQEEIPILLTQTEVLTETLREYLEDSAITKITIIGGDAAVSPAVADELESMGITVERVAGVNRFATAVAVAVARGYLSIADIDRLILAEVEGRDDIWVPGFAAAANGGLFNGPILLTDGLILPIETFSYIAQGLPDNLANGGGDPVICTSFVNLLACETAALLMLGAVAEVVDLIGTLPEPIGTLPEIIFGPDDEEPPPSEEPTEEPTGEPTEEPPAEECLFPAPFPCVPPPA